MFLRRLPKSNQTLRFVNGIAALLLVGGCAAGGSVDAVPTGGPDAAAAGDAAHDAAALDAGAADTTVGGLPADATAATAWTDVAQVDADGGASVSHVLVGGANNLGQGFVPLGPGSSLPISPGWQGMQHLWISVRTPALSAPGGKVVITIYLHDAESGAVLQPGPTQAIAALVPDPSDPSLVGYDGIPAVVRCPCQAKGRPVRIRARIEGVEGPDGETETVPTWVAPCPGKEPPSCGDTAP